MRSYVAANVLRTMLGLFFLIFATGQVRLLD
jgi:hypothetical protein